MAVEHTGKLVAVNLTSGSKDCPIRLSKSTITSAGKQSAHVSSKKAKKKGYKSMLHRLLNCHRYRESQINIGWNETHGERYDAIAGQSASAGPKGPMNQLEVHHEAIKIKERLFEESGKGNTRLQPTTRSLKESTPKPDGDGVLKLIFVVVEII